MGRLMYLLSWGILIYIGYRILMGFIQSRKQDRPQTGQGGGGDTTPHDESPTFQDPVCGRYITEEDAIIGKNGTQRIHFCSRECLEEYRIRLERETGSGRDGVELKPHDH